MRRVITLISCFVAAGFVANAIATILIAVAMDVLAATPNQVGGMGFVDGTKQVGGYFLDGIHWSVKRRTYFGSEFVSSAARVNQNPGITEFPPLKAVPAWLDIPEPSQENMSHLEQRYGEYLAVGWPALSFSCQLRSLVVSDNGQDVGGVRGGLSLPLPPWRATYSHTQRPILPLIPLWRGAIVNTAFYALLFFFPFLPFEIRRHIRRRRGRCLRCGYPLGASAVCSECGRPCVIRPGG